MVGFYADVHVPGPLIRQLRLRGIDIICATEERTNELQDDELLAEAAKLHRVMVTQDIRFRVMAEQWQREDKDFSGLIFAHQRYVGFEEFVNDLELIGKLTDIDYWRSHIEQLPL